MNNTTPDPSSAQGHSSEAYTRDFFLALAHGAQRSAELIVPLVLARYPARSVVDVGCGIGIWAATFEQCGIADVWGVDGDYVDREMLRIPKERFSTADLTQPLKMGRRFDLAVCLEVAEHLPEAAASTLVDSLIRLSDVVLFSAALPGQGGTNHINEQWPDYWAELFKHRGYEAIDCIRPLVWDNADVDWWYAQNTIIYALSDAAALSIDLGTGQVLDGGKPMRLVHPRAFTTVRRELQALRDHVSTSGIV